jgi:hypothetical protein
MPEAIPLCAGSACVERERLAGHEDAGGAGRPCSSLPARKNAPGCPVNTPARYSASTPTCIASPTTKTRFGPWRRTRPRPRLVSGLLAVRPRTLRPDRAASQPDTDRRLRDQLLLFFLFLLPIAAGRSRPEAPGSPSQRTASTLFPSRSITNAAYAA